MKIAIPTANGKLTMHFGHCETFSIIIVDDATKAISSTEEIKAPAHEPGLLPRWLAEKGVDLIIAGGMGQRAQQLFTDQNIDVIVGAPAEEVEVIVNRHLAGTLIAGINLCDH